MNLTATLNHEEAFRGPQFIIISTPTNYDDVMNNFDTSSVEENISKIAEINPAATIVIKSTVPVGFTIRMQKSYPNIKIVFSPE